MKKGSLRSIFPLIILALFIIHTIVNVKTLWDEHKLNSISDKALDVFNDNNLTEAYELLNKGDKIYERVKLLRKITLNNEIGYSYVNTSKSVKGRMALKNNQIELSKTHLLESADIKSTPTLSSFGPNMSLAKDLLIKGESKIVIEYLNKCEVFWEHNDGKLDNWKEQISRAKIPDFGANLIY